MTKGVIETSYLDKKEKSSYQKTLLVTKKNIYCNL